MKHPKPGDIINTGKQSFTCCTLEHLRAYGLFPQLHVKHIVGYYPDTRSEYGISWNFWPADYEFYKVIQAQCNRTYRHGDKFQGQTLLSATFLADQLREIDSELVYFKDNAFSAFEYADPKPGDTIVTRGGLAWTACTAEHLQATYNLGHKAKTGEVFGFCPTGHLHPTPVRWMVWDLKGAPTHDDYVITKVIQAHCNKVDHLEGDNATIGAVKCRLMHRKAVLETMTSDAAVLFSFDERGYLNEHCDLKLA